MFEADRLLPGDPRKALRTLDRIRDRPDDPRHMPSYARAMAQRLVAHLLTGDDRQADAAARELADVGPSPSDLGMVSLWLLTCPREVASVADRLVPPTGCGRRPCLHASTVELSLTAINRFETAEARLELAQRLANAAPWSPDLLRAVARELVSLDDIDQAVAVLATIDDDRSRRATAVTLYASGRMNEAAHFLPADDRLARASRLAMMPEGDWLDPARLTVTSDAVLDALEAERAAEWLVAGGHWARAHRDAEAWETRLVAGVVTPVPHVPAAWWDWRRYALTGSARPSVPPADEVSGSHAAIGDARRDLIDIIAGGFPQAPEEAADPYEMQTLVSFVRGVIADPQWTYSRISVMPAVARPRDLPAALAASTRLPSTDPPQARIDAIRDWMTPFDKVAVQEPAALANVGSRRKILDDAGTAVIDGAAAGLTPRERLAALALACSTGDGAVMDRVEAALADEDLCAAWPECAHEWTALCAAVAAQVGFPTDTRARAGELAAGLLARLVLDGRASSDAGARAAQIVQDSLGDVAVAQTRFLPSTAFSLEQGALATMANRMTDREPGPVLAAAFGLDAVPSVARSTHAERLYGPMGRAWLLNDAGRPDGALAAAESAAGGAWSPDVPAPFRAAVVVRRAEVGRFEEALGLLEQTQGHAASAASEVAAAIQARMGDDELERAISLLTRLFAAYPHEVAVKAALSRRLNRRAVKRPAGDAELLMDIADLERALSLDPDNLPAQRNLAMSLFNKAVDVYEQDPQRALGLVRRVVALVPNDGELHRTSCRLALMIATVFMERRRKSDAKAAVALALEIDPSDRDARQIWYRLS